MGGGREEGGRATGVRGLIFILLIRQYLKIHCLFLFS